MEAKKSLRLTEPSCLSRECERTPQQLAPLGHACASKGLGKYKGEENDGTISQTPVNLARPARINRSNTKLLTRKPWAPLRSGAVLWSAHKLSNALEGHEMKEAAMNEFSNAAAQEIRRIESQRLTVGLDLGDRSGWYCVLDGAAEVTLEQKVSTSPKAMREGPT